MIDVVVLSPAAVVAQAGQRDYLTAELETGIGYALKTAWTCGERKLELGRIREGPVKCSGAIGQSVAGTLTCGPGHPGASSYVSMLW